MMELPPYHVPTLKGIIVACVGSCQAICKRSGADHNTYGAGAEFIELYWH